MANFAGSHGIRILELLERALGVIADPHKSLHEIISSDNEANGHYLELQRMLAALKTYLDTDPNLRYVAFVGSFSSGKTATINNLLKIRDKERTMDRTRQLFGDRGSELESYSTSLLECVTAMREIH